MEFDLYFENPNTHVIVTDTYISLIRGNNDLTIHKGLRGETRIFYNQIIEIKLKQPTGAGKGYLQFSTARTSALGALRTADQPQNTVKFKKNRLHDALALRDFVNAKISNDDQAAQAALNQIHDSLQLHKKRKNKGCLSKVLVVLAIILAFFIILVVAALNSDSGNDSATNSEPQTSNSQLNVDSEKHDKSDEIIRKARADAENITDAQTQEAVEYIYDNYGHYFDSDEIMEKMIYYGYLLECGYEDDYKTDLTAKTYTDLGSDAHRLVKYVYIGSESSTDDRMEINLKQIREDLTYLGYSVN